MKITSTELCNSQWKEKKYTVEKDICYRPQIDTGGDAWWDICISRASYTSITLGKKSNNADILQN